MKTKRSRRDKERQESIKQDVDKLVHSVLADASKNKIKKFKKHVKISREEVTNALAMFENISC